MGAQRVTAALVGRKMSLNAGYTDPAIGDKVMISGDNEVNLVTDGARSIGEVFQVHPVSGNTAAALTIELRTSRVDSLIAQVTITAGDKIMNFDRTKGRIFLPGSEDSVDVYGIALTGAAQDGSFDCAVIE